MKWKEIQTWEEFAAKNKEPLDIEGFDPNEDEYPIEVFARLGKKEYEEELKKCTIMAL